MGFELKDMTEADLDQVCRLEEESFLTPWSRKALLDEINNPLANYLLVMDGDIAVAYGGFWAVGPEGNINNIAVAPAYRGRGISKILMGALIERAEDKGIKELFLEVRASNYIAQKLYRSLDFKMIDVRRGYYADTDEDALVMVLEIE